MYTVVDYIELVDIAGAKWSVRAFFLVQVPSPNGRKKCVCVRAKGMWEKKNFLTIYHILKWWSPPLYGLNGNVILPEEQFLRRRRPS